MWHGHVARCVYQALCVGGRSLGADMVGAGGLRGGRPCRHILAPCPMSYTCRDVTELWASAGQEGRPEGGKGGACIEVPSCRMCGPGPSGDEGLRISSVTGLRMGALPVAVGVSHLMIHLLASSLAPQEKPAATEWWSWWMMSCG